MLRSLFSLLFGCSHARTSFPRTEPRISAVDGRTRNETHVTCLTCGKELLYDWRKMEIDDSEGLHLPGWLRRVMKR